MPIGCQGHDRLITAKQANGADCTCMHVMQLRDLVPPQTKDSVSTSQEMQDPTKRPKHVVLSDTITLVKSLQHKARPTRRKNTRVVALQRQKSGVGLGACNAHACRHLHCRGHSWFLREPGSQVVHMRRAGGGCREGFAARAERRARGQHRERGAGSAAAFPAGGHHLQQRLHLLLGPLQRPPPGARAALPWVWMQVAEWRSALRHRLSRPPI